MWTPSSSFPVGHCSVILAPPARRGDTSGCRVVPAGPGSACAATGPGRVWCERSVGLTLGDLVGGVVARVDQLLLDVGLVDRDDREEVGRHDLLTVVVGLRVVRLRLVALEEGGGRGH